MRILAISLAIGSVASALAVQIGDSREAVLLELGKPQSTLSAGGREFLIYPEGRVQITDGKVSEFKMTTPNAPTPAPSPKSPPAPAATPPASIPPAPERSVQTQIPVQAKRRAAQWHTSIAEAETIAAKENKMILALFTGSDWCGPCQQFEAEVAHDEQFAGIFSNAFIFFKSDWLRNTPQPESVQAEVGRLKRKYFITAYPTLLVLNAKGEKLDEVAWTKIQAGSFKECMIEAIDNSRKATKGGKKTGGGWWPF